MTQDAPARPATRRESPYRLAAHAPVPNERSGWGVFLIDGCLVLVIAITVATVGRWPAFVDVAASRFLGF